MAHEIADKIEKGESKDTSQQSDGKQSRRNEKIFKTLANTIKTRPMKNEIKSTTHKRVKTTLYDLKAINSEKPPLHSNESSHFESRQKFQKYSDFLKKNPNADGNLSNAKKFQNRRRANIIILNSSKRGEAYSGVKKIVQQINHSVQEDHSNLFGQVNDKKHTKKYSDFIPKTIKLKRKKFLEEKQKGMHNQTKVATTLLNFEN